MTEDDTSQRAETGFSALADVRLAVAFLTRLPLPSFLDSRPLARAAWAFPVAGAVVGAAGAAVVYATGWAELHPLACALLGVAAMAATSGGLHEDGFADVADGFGAGRDRDVKLTVMRDSRVGTYGVLALVFSVGIRAALVAGLPGRGAAALAMLAAATAARGVMPAVMAALPNARGDGLSSGAGRPTAEMAWAALALGFGVHVVLAWTTLGLSAAVMGVVFGVVGAAGVAMLAKQQIGGQTGDVLGAAAQVAEIGILIGWAGSKWTMS